MVSIKYLMSDDEVLLLVYFCYLSNVSFTSKRSSERALRGPEKREHNGESSCVDQIVIKITKFFSNFGIQL